MTDAIFYDRGEFLAAAAAPEYATSARYRDEVAAKLQRSLEAGTVTPMGQEVTHEVRTDPYRIERTMPLAEQGLYGAGVPATGALPQWAEAAKVGNGSFFKSVEEVALAMAAPAYEADPTYRDAVYEKMQRSFREGTLDPALFNPAP